MSKALAVCCLALSFAFVVSASDWDKRTVITLHEPLIVAGVPVVTLEPGKYVMRLLDSPSNRHIVQIFNEREDKLFTTVLAIPNYRLEPKDKTGFAFWETPAGNPTLYVPGSTQETTSARSSFIRRAWLPRLPKKPAPQ